MKKNRYWAFISYSSKDARMGSWLHRRLESYTIPKEFRGKEVFDSVSLGKNLRPVFRDRDELPGSSDLGSAINRALEASQFLVVLCSRNSAKSKWVNKEIEFFKSLGKQDRILALILDGEPNSSLRGLPEFECFPPALQGQTQPIAGDLRKVGDGREKGFLKILSGISQMDFDKLYRRNRRIKWKRIRRLSILAVVVIYLTNFLMMALQYGVQVHDEYFKGAAYYEIERLIEEIDNTESKIKESLKIMEELQKEIGQYFSGYTYIDSNKSESTKEAVLRLKNYEKEIELEKLMMVLRNIEKKSEDESN